ncbi:hypothetical protein C1645_757399 [Glomus cerebriforme]|uniref:FBX41/ZN365 C2H2-type zinc finger domain-containing protein n=1 Tax=Glomus cerebriforme TaxID=658196 RepID=A0A397TKX1_9GLOM|nr:hypothetical protein C1645_757399 [Glomus cerebriforme]
MPFKCPICDSSRRFRSFDKLERHLIFIHRERVLDFTDIDDMMGQEGILSKMILLYSS